MHPTRSRTARVAAQDVRPGDELHTTGGWYRVLDAARSGAVVRIKLDESGAVLEPHVYAAGEPVMVAWQVPTTTAGMAAQLRRASIHARAATRTAR